MRRPHSVYISPYDPQKRVWIVDDNMQAIYIFTHDGKQLLQTIGTPEQEGADATHFNRPTYIDWLPDGTFFVSDGYTGTRVAKFDKNGKFVMQWGIKGNPPNEKRPGYMNNVHGVAVDPINRHVFVNDRNNHRIQVFDENGKYLSEWHIDADPSSLHLLYIGADRNVWTFDRSTNKMVQYDQEGHLKYAWGTMGNFAGGLWGVHGMSVDQDGNLYVAEVDSGRVQKFRPRRGREPGVSRRQAGHARLGQREEARVMAGAGPPRGARWVRGSQGKGEGEEGHETQKKPPGGGPDHPRTTTGGPSRSGRSSTPGIPRRVRSSPSSARPR